MNTALWFSQTIMSFIFMYSGINKSIFSIRKLVDEKGQTGIEDLSLLLVRCIGISEIVGAIGLTFPWMLQIMPILTPIAAILLSSIMIPAAIIHYKRKEPKNIITNVIIFFSCLFIGYGRTFL